MINNLKNYLFFSKESNISNIMLVFFLVFLINILLTAVGKIIISYYNVNIIYNQPIKEVLNNKLIGALKIGIFVPIIEEFVFRSVLVPTKRTLSLFLFGFITLILRLFDLDMTFSVLVVFIVSLFYYFKEETFSKSLIQNIFNHQKLLIIISSVLFGLAHLLNYKFELKNILFLPLIILSPIFFGFFLAYTRIKLGLFYSITFHIINNLILISILFIINEMVS